MNHKKLSPAGLPKKKVTQMNQKPTGKSLGPATYWKYRTAEETLQHETTKLKLAQKSREYRLLEENYAELLKKAAQVETSVATKSLIEQNKVLKEALTEYNEVKAEVEKEIGRSLVNCEIDPVTFRVMESDTKEE